METPRTPTKTKTIPRTPARQMQTQESIMQGAPIFKSKKKLMFDQDDKPDQQDGEQLKNIMNTENITVNQWIDLVLNKIEDEKFSVEDMRNLLIEYKYIYERYFIILQDLFKETFQKKIVKSQLQANKMKTVMTYFTNLAEYKQNRENVPSNLNQLFNEIPSRIGPKRDPEKYNIVEVLGEGAFGTTYKAKNINKEQNENDYYSIKILNPGPGAKAKWIRERQCLIDVIEICKEGGILCYKDSFFIKNSKGDDIFIIVTPFLEGYITLFDYLTKNSVTEYEAKNIYKQVVQTKNRLSEICIHHSDLNLRNIMYNPETKSVKIIDLGLCQTPEEERKYWGKNYNLYSDKAQIYNLGIYLFFKVHQREPKDYEEVKTLFDDKIKATKPCKRVYKNIK